MPLLFLSLSRCTLARFFSNRATLGGARCRARREASGELDLSIAADRRKVSAPWAGKSRTVRVMGKATAETIRISFRLVSETTRINQCLEPALAPTARFEPMLATGSRTTT